MVHKKGLEFGKESLRVALDEMEDMEKLINECRSDALDIHIYSETNKEYK